MELWKDDRVKEKTNIENIKRAGWNKERKENQCLDYILFIHNFVIQGSYSRVILPVHSG